MNALPLENAKQVLGLELRRPDSLLSAHYKNALNGDIASTAACLNVMAQRAKLLGLYPEQGKVSVLIAQQLAGEGAGVMPVAQIEFTVRLVTMIVGIVD